MTYSEKAVIHDHFDGSAHCIECGGHCRLRGTEMAYTALVRALFENAVFNDKPIPYRILKTLENSGVHFEKLQKRAEECSGERVK